MKISILTATYNRAKYLGKLYDSLLNNISDEYQIEWLIMDDGSEDNTESVCNSFKNKEGIEIKYFKQENQGKMQAINNLAKYVTGDLWIECDSDDYFEKDSFSKVQKTYKENKERADVYGYAFLKEDQTGRNMGQEFKNHENTMFDLYFKDGENGEKAVVFVSKIRKNFKYELEKEEKFITEARMYHKMDKSYKIICQNDYLMVCEYQEAGYTKNFDKQFIDNPYGYYRYFYEILNEMDTKNILMKKRLYAVKHFILFAFLTKQKSLGKAKKFIDKLLIAILYIPGNIKSYLYKRKLEC